MARLVSPRRWTLTLSAIVALQSVSAAADADQQGEEEEAAPTSFADELLESLVHGKPVLDMRLRWEAADIQTFQKSSAITLRTRVGYGTRPLHGVSAFVEMENIAAIQENYFNGVPPNSNRETVITDPEDTQVNRAFAKIALPALDGVPAHESAFTVGRQRIIFDDSRFIGNVGWRQNEQTYDALRFDTNLFVASAKATYVYLWQVNRIFGDRGRAPSGTKDSTMDGHLINVSYSPLEWMKAVAFVYLLQFDDLRSNPGLAANNSATYGGRLQLDYAINDELAVGMLGSAAFQEDYERVGTNAAFEAWYFWYEASIHYKPLAKLTLAWEQLGSDGGNFQFRTPLATLHKFNGFSDTFLTSLAGGAANGGPRGLRDYMVTLAPKLPFGFTGFARYHYYTTDQGGGRIGWEVEGVLTRKIYKHLSVLSKAAYFESDPSGGSPATLDRWRFWLDLTFAF